MGQMRKPLLPDKIDLAALIDEQGTRPFSNEPTVVGGTWPKEDCVNEFLQQVREIRENGDRKGRFL